MLRLESTTPAGFLVALLCFYFFAGHYTLVNRSASHDEEILSQICPALNGAKQNLWQVMKLAGHGIILQFLAGEHRPPLKVQKIHNLSFLIMGTPIQCNR